MDVFLNPTLCSWIHFLMIVSPVFFTVWLRKQLPMAGSTRLLLLGKSLPRASWAGMGFGPLRGDPCMLIQSSQKYLRSRTVKQAGERILWESLFVWCGVVCTVGVPAAGRARVGAWGGNGHTLLSHCCPLQEPSSFSALLVSTPRIVVIQ